MPQHPRREGGRLVQGRPDQLVFELVSALDLGSSRARWARSAHRAMCSTDWSASSAISSMSSELPATAATRSISSAPGPQRRARATTAAWSDTGIAWLSASSVSARNASTTNSVWPRVSESTSGARSCKPMRVASSTTADSAVAPTRPRPRTDPSCSSASSASSARSVASTSNGAAGSHRRRKCNSSTVDAPARCRSSSTTRSGRCRARATRKLATASNVLRRSSSASAGW